MSYARMDHADWVQRQIDATRREAANRVQKGKQPTATWRKAMAAGKGWPGAPDRLSPFQACLFDIIGIACGGIYNAQLDWDSLDWRYGRGVSMAYWGGLATFDLNCLSTLVLLCHEARIRFSVECSRPCRLRLSFWPRAATGDVASRHPNLDEAVAALRALLPADHRIFQYAASLLPSAEAAA